MPKVLQSRKWSLVTYLPPSQIAEIFSCKADKVRAYAYATHDKDEGKEIHTHVIIWTNTPYARSSIINWFRGIDDNGLLVNTLAEPCKDISAMFRYLTHADNPEKYQYSADYVICSDPSYFEEVCDSDDTYMSLQDLLDGVPLREVARRYGRDFIYHYSHIRALLHDIKEEELE